MIHPYPPTGKWIIRVGHPLPNVGGIKPKPRLPMGDFLLIGRKRMDERHDDEADEKHTVVEGEDAQRPPRIKIAEVMRRALSVQKDAGDEKPAENEEEIDPDVADTRHRLGDGPDRRMPLPRRREVTT